mmetsp:Transcript_22562/g.37320  ORF Transcript_22562/g.37320 Transcript_22562/m.37320 type:complete len:270 (+) Transcript_22562:120-929(+)
MSRMMRVALIPLLLLTADAFCRSPAANSFGRLNLRLFAEQEEVDWESAFPSAEVLEVSLPDHKPLGCSVEESLGDTALKPVFVSKVVPGGNAAKAGIKVGDVIVGVTGIFGGLRSVLGKGIDEVTSSVAGRADDEVLDFRIVRGTRVLNEHESALVDLCASYGADDQEIEDCVVSFLTSTYEDDDEEEELEPAEGCDDDDEECRLNDMFENIWGEELQESAPPTVNKEEAEKEEEKPKSKKPLPWRLRSSPSGTFVRDPKTGEMKNIDA